ncbi:MAG: hypothetical protein EXR80_06305 [Methylococcales bacterium]|nr:hypothetical protein [Methylococcales bacterium]
MSNEENIEPVIDTEQSAETEQVIDSPSDQAGNVISLLLDLKEKNPKVFFGAIGGVVVLLLILMMSGGNDEKIVTGPTIKNLAVGQKYVLKSANSYDPAAAVRLVGVPGAIAAYDDTEEADRNAACQHIPQGTSVSVLELQDAYGTKNAFVKVQMEEGECKGKDGWALAIDVQ